MKALQSLMLASLAFVALHDVSARAQTSAAPSSDTTSVAPQASDQPFPAPQGGSFPVWIEPEELTPAERHISGYGDAILGFSLRPRSVVRLDSAVERQSMMRLEVDAGTVLNEATFPGIERMSRLVDRPIPLAYCTPDGALRDMWGNRRWRACFVDVDADSIFDKWMDMACAGNEVTGCNDVPPLTMLLGATGLHDLRTPARYSALPAESAPAYLMALVLGGGRAGIELIAVDRAHTGSVRALSRRDLEQIPPEGLTLSAYGARVVVTRTAQDGLHVRVDQNVRRQLGYVQTTVTGFPTRSQQRVIRVAPET